MYWISSTSSGMLGSTHSCNRSGWECTGLAPRPVACLVVHIVVTGAGGNVLD